MKSTLKRFLSLVLCMCMVMALLPNVTMTAFAATSGTVTGLADENIGLSFTGDADDAWSANGTSIIGAATSTGGTCSDTSYKSTLTITNKKSTTATLSFDYSIEQNSGKIQVDGTEVSSGASFTKELATNESVKVYIQSGSTSAATKITLTNVVLVSDVNATAAFVPAENGTYALYYPPPEDEEWPDLYYGPKLSLWYRNGGQITHNYLKHIKKTIRQEIFEYLEKLPLNIELTLNNRQFILTHAAPVELYETYGHKYECERDFAVWMRFDSFPVLEDCTVIFGHTPTIRFQYDNPMAIWDVKSWIGIDCGCMLPEKGDPWSGALGRLSCLRLDDMQVFYSEEPQYDNLKISEEQHDG